MANRLTQEYLNEFRAELCESGCVECDDSRALLAEIDALKAERDELRAKLAEALAKLGRS